MADKTTEPTEEVKKLPVLDKEEYENFKKIFINNLKAVESEWQISKADLAELCGVARPTVTQWFVGVCWPRMISILYIAAAIHREPADFFRKDGIHLTDHMLPIDVVYRDDVSMEQSANRLKEAEKLPPISDDLPDDDSTTLPNSKKKLNGDELSTTERNIIANFRILNKNGRKYILHALNLESKYNKEQLKKKLDESAYKKKQ